MWDIARVAIGPILSVLFFLVGYRRTVGARRERARAAETDLRRLLLRRMIVDGYDPGREALSRLRRERSKRHNVKLSDLPSDEDVLIGLYADALENEFIAQQERDGLLGRLDVALAALVDEASAPAAEPGASPRSVRGRPPSRPPRELPIAAGLLGLVASLIAATLQGGSDYATLLAAVLALLATFVALVLTARIGAEAGGRDDDDDLRTSAKMLEEAVKSVLLSSGAKLQQRGGSGPDFIVEYGETSGPIGFEVKSRTHWQRFMARRVLDQLLQLKEEHDLREVVLVVPTEDAARNFMTSVSATSVQVIPFDRLQDYARALRDAA